MYTQYFGLKEKPFSIAPNPEYVYMSSHHQEALAHLMYGIQEDGCLALLTGEVGTGKTTICRCMLEKTPEHIDMAVVFNPKISSLDLLRTICEELKIDIPQDSGENKIYIDNLNKYLLEAHAKGRTTVLIIDEAQGLTPTVLEQLRLLTNLETNTHKLLKIILLGQPELSVMLQNDDLKQVNQRITSRYHLSPLNYEDTINYLLHRMHVAGGGQSRYFSDKALKILYKKSGGVPRLINLICDRALLGAYAESRSFVDHITMKQAVKEVFSPANVSQKEIKHTRKLVFLLLITALLTATAVYYVQFRQRETTRVTITPLVEKETSLPLQLIAKKQTTAETDAKPQSEVQ